MIDFDVTVQRSPPSVGLIVRTGVKNHYHRLKLYHLSFAPLPVFSTHEATIEWTYSRPPHDDEDRR